MTKKLCVHENGRFLQYEDGKPFFYLGDTAWELFHKLNRDDVKKYLDDRHSKGFNAIQAVALAERDGLNIPNRHGSRPLLKNSDGVYDPSMPDVESEYSYWDHMDYIIDYADSLGMFIVLLPTWGDKFTTMGIGPSVFDEDNAFEYGEFIGNRYKDNNNIIWCLGGDRTLENMKHHSVVNAMAYGIKAAGAEQLMTLHPRGDSSSSTYVHDMDWLDFNMTQTGHGAIGRNVFDLITTDYNLEPVKPVVNGEPLYEIIPVRFNTINGYYDDYDCRVVAYRSVFAGGLGHTYGNNCIWAMIDDTELTEFFIMTWDKALSTIGAKQMGYVKQLMLQHDFFSRKPADYILDKEYEGELKICATMGDGYFMAHSPNGLPITIRDEYITDKHTAKWYYPKTGEYSKEFKITKKRRLIVDPPWSSVGAHPDEDYREVYTAIPENAGKHNDIVLVVYKES